MKKLALDLDALQVESFETTDPRQTPPGTLFGADARTLTPFCITFTCGDSHIRPCAD